LYSNVFAPYGDHLKDIIDNPEPDTLSLAVLRRARLLSEEVSFDCSRRSECDEQQFQDLFDVDHYLSDYVEQDEQLRECVRYVPVWVMEQQQARANGTSSTDGELRVMTFTDEHQRAMMSLRNKECACLF
jgi:hypothetical protein